MPRVMVVYGARPEAIKMAPLVLALRAHPRLTPVVAVTGQHREMLDQVNDLFGIVPEHDLDLMVPGATLADLGARTLHATAALLERERPDVVVVQGDTSSAFVAGLAAFYAGVPVVHLEEGLRTGDLRSPFPEEGNRRLLAPLAALHLAPTETSRRNLLAESVPAAAIAVTGNTVIDALRQAVTVPARFDDPRVARLVATAGAGPLLLVTTHRRESWGEPMRQAMAGVRELVARHRDLRVLVPLHRNPVVRDVVEPMLGPCRRSP